MENYIHKVQYYETDKMKITHHSNYVRWMEEARVFYLDSIGCGFSDFEANGVSSPVVEIECKYKRTTTFDDLVEIEVVIEEYNSITLVFRYEMKNKTNGKIAFIGKSKHCFINEEGRPINLKKLFPEQDAILRSLVVAE